MGTTLAAKQDLLLLPTREDLLATKQDLQLLKKEFQLLATREELLLVKQDVAVLRQEMESRFNLLAHEIAMLSLRMTVRLGSMLFVGFGLTVAAIRLWS